MFRIIIVCLFATVFFAGPAVEVYAQVSGDQEYQLLSGIPGLEAVDTSGNFSDFINSIYRMSIGLASILAVLMIVSIGIRYAATDVAGTRVDLRSQFATVLGGLVLLMGAYVLLEFVNPNLVEFDNKAENFVAIDYTEVESFEIIGVEVEVPLDPSASIVYYVPVTRDGVQTEDKFRTMAECMNYRGAIRCEAIEVSTPITSGTSDAVATVVLSELHNFGGKTEGSSEMCARIQEYAQLTTGRRGWNCTASTGTGPWSAIFITYMTHAAGKTYFPKSTAHSQYIRAALNGNSGMQAHRFGSTYVPKPGDLICVDRAGAPYINYDSAKNTSSFASHCDIVVANEGNVIIGVGGNVSQTVARNTYGAQNGVPVASQKSIAIISLD